MRRRYLNFTRAPLASRFEAPEEVGPDEHPITVSIAPSPHEIVEQIIAELGLQARRRM
jgi:hypothetical protein